MRKRNLKKKKEEDRNVASNRARSYMMNKQKGDDQVDIDIYKKIREKEREKRDFVM